MKRKTCHSLSMCGGDQAEQGRGNLAEGQDTLGCAQGDGPFGHAEDDRRFGILGNGGPPSPADGQHALGPITAHAREQHAHGARAPIFGR